jgi:hypothetical protein
VLKKSFLAAQQNFLGPLMSFVRGHVRDHTDSPKSTTDLRNGAKERDQLSRDFRCRSIFDFSNTIEPQTDTSDLERTPIETSTQGDSSSNAMASLLGEDSL